MVMRNPGSVHAGFELGFGLCVRRRTRLQLTRGCFGSYTPKVRTRQVRGSPAAGTLGSWTERALLRAEPAAAICSCALLANASNGSMTVGERLPRSNVSSL